MKYVIFETTKNDGADPRFIPVMFPNELVHAEVARAMRHVFARQGLDMGVRSAGEVTLPLDEGAITCVGGSETLNLVAHPEDADIIQMNDYCHGRVDSMDTTKTIIRGALQRRTL